MTDIILHHFDPSPFAEKVRLALGIKGLAWKSVQIPMIMPKPLLMPLTGGYRKTPVMQFGADIYADSNLIMRELDRRFPQTSLFPNGEAALSAALANWSDVSFFQPGAGLSMGMNPDLPEPLLKDRKAFFKFMDFDGLEDAIPHLYSQFLAQIDLVEQQFEDGRSYVAGELVGALDILNYFPVWMARGNFPQVDEWMSQFPRVLDWEKRMQQLGHGELQELPAEQALEIALVAQPDPTIAVSRNPAGLEAGQSVAVTPTDYGEDPVYGSLQVLNNSEVVIQREAKEVGRVNNHFPRSGFRVEPC